MRHIAIASILFMLTSVAYAENVPNGLSKSICQQGVQIKESNAIFSAEAGKGEFTKLVATTNFCTDEKVTLGGFLGNILRDEITCICTNQKEFESVGCDRADQRQPVVTTVIARSKSGCVSDAITISKCVSDPAAAYNTACKTGRNMARVTPSAATPAVTGSITSPSQGTPAPIMTTNAAGQPQMPYTSTGGQQSSYPYQASAPMGSSYPASIGYPGYPGYTEPPANLSYPSLSYLSFPSNQYTSTGQGSASTFDRSTTPYVQNLYPTVPLQTVQQNTPVIFPPVSIIIAQPSYVEHGDSIIVSWASVGVTCKIYQDDVLVAESREGTRVVRAPASGTSTIFREQCVGLSGTVIHGSAAVALE